MPGFGGPPAPTALQHDENDTADAHEPNADRDRTPPTRRTTRPKSESEAERTQVLLSRIDDGDAEAREVLFERMHGTVLALVRRRIGATIRARYDTEDLVQSVLAESIRGLERFEYQGDRALARWLTRRVENKIRQRARGLRYGDRDPNRAHPIGPMGAESGAAWSHEPAARDGTPSQIAGRDEERERLRAALEQLPERERRLVELRDLEELDWDQVVERAGESTKKAAQGCHARAWARLAAILVREDD